MGSKLSEVLQDLGFLCVLGTTENVGGISQVVERGTPGTYDSNNGVTVIHDEDGSPYIIRTSHLIDEMAHRFHDFSLKRGANVPHSNDGGYFVREVIPKL